MSSNSERPKKKPAGRIIESRYLRAKPAVPSSSSSANDSAPATNAFGANRPTLATSTTFKDRKSLSTSAKSTTINTAAPRASLSSTSSLNRTQFSTSNSAATLRLSLKPHGKTTKHVSIAPSISSSAARAARSSYAPPRNSTGPIVGSAIRQLVVSSSGRDGHAQSQSESHQSKSVNVEDELVLLYTRLIQWWFVNGKSRCAFDTQTTDAQNQIITVHNLLQEKQRQIDEVQKLIVCKQQFIKVMEVVGSQIRYLEPIMSSFPLFEENYKILANAVLDTVRKMEISNVIIDDLDNLVSRLREFLAAITDASIHRSHAIEMITTLASLYSKLLSTAQAQIVEIRECERLLKEMNIVGVEERSYIAEQIQNEQLKLGEDSGVEGHIEIEWLGSSGKVERVQGTHKPDWMDSVVECLVRR